MTATSRSAEDESRDPTTGASPVAAPADAGAVEGFAVGMSSSDRCANCGAEMAVDQRYCVECGTRRGAPRFTLASATAGPRGAAVTPAVGQMIVPARQRLTVLIAVLAILVAIGVGVLIGHGTSSGIKEPVKVVLSGGSVATGGSGTGSGSGANSAGAKSGGNNTPPPAKKNFFGG